MKLLFTFALLISCASSWAVSIKDDGRFVTYTIPAQEFFDHEQQEAIKASIDYSVRELDRIIPGRGLSREAMAAIREVAQQDLGHLVEELQLIATRSDAGLHPSQLVPAAYMVLVGGRAEIDWGIGLGISGTVGIVLCPTQVIRVDKVTKAVVKTYTVRASAIFFPHASVGGGVGGGFQARGGLGLIFGDLQSPGDVHGGMVGASGGINVLGGITLKGGLIMRKNQAPLVMAQALAGIGPMISASVHGNLGVIWNFEEIQENILKQPTQSKVNYGPGATKGQVLNQIRTGQH